MMSPAAMRTSLLLPPDEVPLSGSITAMVAAGRGLASMTSPTPSPRAWLADTVRVSRATAGARGRARFGRDRFKRNLRRWGGSPEAAAVLKVRRRNRIRLRFIYDIRRSGDAPGGPGGAVHQLHAQ